MATYASLSIEQKYLYKALYNDVVLAMEAATLTGNWVEMDRVEAMLARLPVATPPVVPTTTSVSNGNTVQVRGGSQSAVGYVQGVARVSSGTLQDVTLDDAVAIVYNNLSVDVLDSNNQTLLSNCVVRAVSGKMYGVVLPTIYAAIQTGTTIPIRSSAGVSMGTASAVVQGGAVAYAALPATSAVVSNAAAVPVRNSAGANAVSATAVIANGALAGVNLPATHALLQSGVALTLPVTGVIGTKITPTIVAGVITGFALSL